MPKPKTKPTAQEILSILDSMWVDKKGITIIAYCGDNTAGEHMKAIKNIVKSKYNRECPRNVVPTNEVIDYFDIDVKYLRKVAGL